MTSEKNLEQYLAHLRERYPFGDKLQQQTIDAITRKIGHSKIKYRGSEKNEFFKLVDQSGCSTSLCAVRWICHLLGFRHRSVHVLLYFMTPNGKVFIFQIRDWNKNDSPGQLDITVGGHTVGKGEDCMSTAYREMKEELGLMKSDLDQNALTYLSGYEFYEENRATNFYNSEWRDILIGAIDVAKIEKIKFKDSEVVGLYLCPEKEAVKLLQQQHLPMASALRNSLPLVLSSKQNDYLAALTNYANRMPAKLFKFLSILFSSEQIPPLLGYKVSYIFARNEEHGFIHGLETLMILLKLLEKQKVRLNLELEQLALATILHDIGYFSSVTTLDSQDHHINGLELFKSFLRYCLPNISRYKVRMMLEMILSHRGKDPSFPGPTTFEAKLLCDADSLAEIHMERIAKIDKKREFIRLPSSPTKQDVKHYVDHLVQIIYQKRQQDLLRSRGGDILTALLYNAIVWTNPNCYYLDVSKRYLLTNNYPSKAQKQVIDQTKILSKGIVQYRITLKIINAVYSHICLIPEFNYLVPLTK